MIEERGFGKINIGLQILGKRPDGYHEIDTVFQSIGLYDRIQLEESPSFQLTCSHPDLPCDTSNLAYKAYQAVCDYTGRHDGVHIHIDKQIPLAAGLAGGSTDCAAVLRGLNRLWALGLSSIELERLGAALGADVPFCVHGGTWRGRGVGDKLEPLPALPEWPVLVLHPHVPVRTQEAYALFDTMADIPAVPMERIVQAVKGHDFADVVTSMDNTFVYLVKPGVPEIGYCYTLLANHGLKPLVSGSGPTTFAFVESMPQAQTIYQALRAEARDIDIYCTTLVGGEVETHENSETAGT